MKELFEALDCVLKAQQKQIDMLHNRLKGIEDDYCKLNETLFEEYMVRLDETGFASFNEKHGEKFKNIDETMRKLPGQENYSASKKVWDDLKMKPWTKDFDEDAEVDKILGQAIKALDVLKSKVSPEQQQAIEQAKDDIKEAAIPNDIANADISDAEKAQTEDADDWSEDMIKAEWEKSKNKKGY